MYYFLKENICLMEEKLNARTLTLVRKEKVHITPIKYCQSPDIPKLFFGSIYPLNYSIWSNLHLIRFIFFIYPCTSEVSS